MSSSSTALVASLSLTTLFMLGCGDEAIEKALCESTAKVACEKVYSCPAGVVLRALYTDVNNCKSALSASCANSEQLYGCDIDNAKLRSCQDKLSGSSCGTWPAECTALLKCK